MLAMGDAFIAADRIASARNISVGCLMVPPVQRRIVDLERAVGVAGGNTDYHHRLL